MEVTQGLSVGEKLVTQGSLSLYAESRKTQTAKVSPAPVASPPVPEVTEVPVTTAQVEVNNTPPQQSEFPLAMAVGGGAGVLALGGAIAFWASNKKQRGL